MQRSREPHQNGTRSVTFAPERHARDRPRELARSDAREHRNPERAGQGRRTRGSECCWAKESVAGRPAQSQRTGKRTLADATRAGVARRSGGYAVWGSHSASVSGSVGWQLRYTASAARRHRGQEPAGSCFRSRRGHLRALGRPRRESKQESGRPRGWQGPGLPLSACG